MLVTLCSCSWAEDDPFADLPIAFQLRIGNRQSSAKFENQIFNFRACHNGEFVNQIDMDWAVLSPGVGCLDDNWWAGITARYLNDPSGRPELASWDPEPALMYFQFHHRTSGVEGRVYIPLIWKIEEKLIRPWIELENLRMLRFGKQTELFLRGQYELGGSLQGEIGLRQRFKGIDFEATTSGAYSIGAKYTTAF